MDRMKLEKLKEESCAWFKYFIAWFKEEEESVASQTKKVNVAHIQGGGEFEICCFLHLNNV